MLKEDIIEGDLVSDLIPLHSGHLSITGAQLSELLERAALKGYLLAEEKRQYYLTTPDGLRDKTIACYKPLSYRVARKQSSYLLSVPGTGTEEWGGDTPLDWPPELTAEINSKLFSVFPHPLLLEERTVT